MRKTSSRRVWGMPFYDIALGPCPERNQRRGEARGVIAIGGLALGVVSLGGLGCGLVCRSVCWAPPEGWRSVCVLPAAPLRLLYNAPGAIAVGQKVPGALTYMLFQSL